MDGAKLLRDRGVGQAAAEKIIAAGEEAHAARHAAEIREIAPPAADERAVAADMDMIADHQPFVSSEKNKVVDHHVAADLNPLGMDHANGIADDDVLAAMGQSQTGGIDRVFDHGNPTGRGIIELATITRESHSRPSPSTQQRRRGFRSLRESGRSREGFNGKRTGPEGPVHRPSPYLVGGV